MVVHVTDPLHWVPVVDHSHTQPPVADHLPSGWAQEPSARVAGLDGLRGLAVVAVLLFHLWPSLLPGGFIGVPVFFALSGFLITSLLIRELDHTGTISLSRFYSRRVRRLMPASLLTLTAIAVGWALAGWLTVEVRRDLAYSLGQSLNWGKVLEQSRYGVDAEASPVLHYWSLAIEEQMYLLLPVAILLCRVRRRAIVLVTAGLLGSVIAVVAAAGSPSLSYYSTFTRSGEVLVGVLTALILHEHRWSHRASRATALALTAAGLLALLIVALRLTVTDPAVSSGGLLACATVASLVIAGVAGWPALGRHIDWWPLARLGQISYAVYLFHWPILQALRHTSIDPALVPLVTLSATLVLALMSERWLERPIRSGKVHMPRLITAATMAAVLVLLVGAVGVTPVTGESNFEAAATQFDDLVVTETTVQPTTTPTASVPDILRPGEDEPSTAAPEEPSVPPFVGFFGDSKALTLGLGAARQNDGQFSVGASYTPLGCPTGRGGKVRAAASSPAYPLDDACDWAIGIPESAAEHAAIEVAVVWSGTWDLYDRSVPALGGGWTSIDDGPYRDWLLSEALGLTDLITSVTGATTVLWLTVPVDPNSPHPERFAAWTLLLEELRALRPGVVEIVDVAAFVESSGEAARLLPDGVHPSYGTADPSVNSAAELTRALILPRLHEP